MKNTFLFLSALILVNFARTQAVATEYVLSNAEAPGVTFAIGYSLGTHDGEVSQMDASVKLTEKNKILSGDFSVPLLSISTGNSTRDCHMVEALGINYENSQFPNQHVCSDDLLPESGPDSMAFDSIKFKFVSVNDQAGKGLPEVLEAGKTYALNIQGEWSIHGITKTAASLPIKVKLLDAATGELQLFGKFEISLTDYNIIVKPFKIAFVSIGVDEIAKVTINTRMSLKK